MNVLIVVAHPDDEVLGCGATVAALTHSQHRATACFLSGHAEARGGRPVGNELLADTNKAQSILGLGAPILGSFPNIRLNTVAHIELVQFIERALVQTEAEIVFTHHPADINDDHLQTSRACQAAVRLFQRRPGVKRLRALYFMEVLSATDWSFAGGMEQFRPDTFVDVSESIERKIEALRAYRGVLRPKPHPRSEEVVQALAQYRGGQSGYLAAEAFQTAFVSGSASEVFNA